MGLKYYSEDLNPSGHHRPLSSTFGLSSYENTTLSYYQNQSYISPSTLKTNIDNHIYASIRNYNDTDRSRKATDYYHNNIYANVSKSVTKSISILDETFYTTLDNTKSSNIDKSTDVQLFEKSKNANPIYQNVKSSLKTLLPSKDRKKSSTSSHHYVNLQENYQQLPISEKNNSSNEIRCTASIYSQERKQIDIETRTNTNTIQVSLITLIKGSIGKKIFKIEHKEC